MERKERIAPAHLPNSKRDITYRDSVELAEKAGASGGRMYHNGQWRGEMGTGLGLIGMGTIDITNLGQSYGSRGGGGYRERWWWWRKI